MAWSSREWTEKYVGSRRAWLHEYKQERGCVDCGARDKRLDFDHRPGTEKRFNLGHPRASWETIYAEVAKCDVRCISCHTARHNRERAVSARKAKGLIA